MSRRDRRRAEVRGRGAEWIAIALLTAKGYRIAARRYRSRVGEIDIVARKSGAIVFVEVKARTDRDSALAAVSPVSARRRIVNAARDWQMRHPRDAARPARFDVIAVAPWRWPAHITSAFEAEG